MLEFLKKHWKGILIAIIIIVIVIIILVISILTKKYWLNFLSFLSPLFSSLLPTEENRRRRIEEQIAKLKEKLGILEEDDNVYKTDILKLKSEIEKLKNDKKLLIDKLLELKNKDPRTITDEEIDNFVREFMN